MKDEEANEIKIRSKRKPRSCLQTWLGPVEIPLLEACPKPIKFYLPGPKTITFDSGATSISIHAVLFEVSSGSFPARVSWITREIGRGPLIFAARVVSDPIMHVDRNYGFN